MEIRQSIAGAGDTTVSVLPRERGLLACPAHPRVPATSLLTAQFGGVQARRGWGAGHLSPLPLPRSPSLRPDFPLLLVSPDVPSRDPRGRFSALAQREGSAARLPSSGQGHLALLGIKLLELACAPSLGGRRREAALPGPRDPTSLSPFRGPGNMNLPTLAQRLLAKGRVSPAQQSLRAEKKNEGPVFSGGNFLTHIVTLLEGHRHTHLCVLLSSEFRAPCSLWALNEYLRQE